MKLGFNLRLRLHKERGGIVESSFRRVKDEFSSLPPGHKGGTIDPYVAVGRDEALFTYLNNWRDRSFDGRLF
ncbi:hypothetical protein [Chamaesiphon minutus]|uniref:hypothetical protein n=1 Tax=Chamaesiphon minutus TaxID=1173032 RepID=UPI0002EC8FD2|nr:hypothetical protein [Chamaesiphon minutus]